MVVSVFSCTLEGFDGLAVGCHGHGLIRHHVVPGGAALGASLPPLICFWPVPSSLSGRRICTNEGRTPPGRPPLWPARGRVADKGDGELAAEDEHTVESRRRSVCRGGESLSAAKGEGRYNLFFPSLVRGGSV